MRNDKSQSPAARDIRDDAGDPQLGMSWSQSTPKITWISDTPSVVRPDIAALRASQDLGARDGGLPQNSTGKLNEALAQEVEFLDIPAIQGKE